MSDSSLELLIIELSKFPLGNLVTTPNALQHLAHGDIQAALNRHANGDWGNLDEEDKQVNERALKEGQRLLSSYQTTTGVKFWIITEWDRSATTILLPEDY